jgi:hypothetical protein
LAVKAIGLPWGLFLLARPGSGISELRFQLLHGPLHARRGLLDTAGGAADAAVVAVA